MEFKDKVYEARMQLGLSQTEFAKALGVGFATINRWENCNYNPSRLAKKAFEDFCNKHSIEF